MSRFTLILIVVFYGLSFVWCREMFSGWQEDAASLKSPDEEGAAKFVTLLLWGITVMMMFGMLLLTVYLGLQLKNNL